MRVSSLISSKVCVWQSVNRLEVLESEKAGMAWLTGHLPMYAGKLVAFCEATAQHEANTGWQSLLLDVVARVCRDAISLNGEC